jgi:hypothetical protein
MRVDILTRNGPGHREHGTRGRMSRFCSRSKFLNILLAKQFTQHNLLVLMECVNVGEIY